MITNWRSAMEYGSWRFTASFMTLVLIGTALNLQAQLKDARDAFASPAPNPAQLAADAEAEKRTQILFTLQRWGDEGMLPEGRLKIRLGMIQTYPELGKYLAQIAGEMIENRSPGIADVLDAMSKWEDDTAQKSDSSF